MPPKENLHLCTRFDGLKLCKFMHCSKLIFVMWMHFGNQNQNMLKSAEFSLESYSFNLLERWEP